MIVEIAGRLDRWVKARAKEAQEEGLPSPKPCKIRLVGQMALVESAPGLELTNTKDVDVKANYSHDTQKEFERLLAKRGLTLDPVGHEVWMPRETRYSPLFEGRFVTLLVADVDAVLVSKALKAPVKNGPLIRQYIAQGASDRFFDLAARYSVDLGQFT